MNFDVAAFLALTAPARFPVSTSSFAIGGAHAKLRAQRQPLGLKPNPPYLSDVAARSAAYGDPWTCRTSSEVLQRELRARGMTTVVDHVLPDFFAWPGEASRVAYHYFLVDHPEQARLLIDPTIFANGLAKPSTKIVFQSLAGHLAERMNIPRAVAQSLNATIASQSASGLLVLDDPQAIVLFRATLCHLARGGNRALPIRLR